MNKFSKLKPDSKYHIICHANGRDNLFRENENYRFFLQRYHEILFPIVKTYAYCLMPNHFHLLVEIRSESDLSEINDAKYDITNFISKKISNLLNAYAKAFNKKYNRTGSLFQEHLKRIKIEDESYLKNLIVYINTNSSHHNIANYESYKHSSFKDLWSNKKTFLKRNEVIDLFGDIENFKHVHTLKKRDIDSTENMIFED